MDYKMKIAETALLHVLPVQFIQTSTGVVLKRGCTELRITGEGVAGIVQRILQAVSTRKMTVQEIRDQFSSPKRQAVTELIDQLIAKRILTTADHNESLPQGPESSLEIFYWHFGRSASEVTDTLNNYHLAILGVNFISRQMAGSFLASGVSNIDIVDVPLLRNLRLFDENGLLRFDQWNGKLPLDYEGWVEKLDRYSQMCIIATTDFGTHDTLRELNAFCNKRKYHFLPVVLQNLVGFVGPLVVPGETACFECVRARQNSHFNDPETERTTEVESFQGQPFIGFHPSMASILGDIAAFEITRFYSGVLPRKNVGCLLEINLLATSMTSRKVLKVPRCLVCSPLNKTACTEPSKAPTSKASKARKL